MGWRREPGHWLERFCPVTLVGCLGGLLVPEVQELFGAWKIPLKLNTILLCPGGRAKRPHFRMEEPGPASAQPSCLLSSEIGSDETPKACRSSSSKGFLEPCLTGRVLADGTLFPVNENKTKPALVLAGSGHKVKWPWTPSIPLLLTRCLRAKLLWLLIFFLFYLRMGFSV